MTSDRRRTLLLSILASTVFWLGVDALSVARGYTGARWGGLDPIPMSGVLLLIGGLALAIYTVALLLRLVARTPRQRRARWPLVLCVIGLMACHAMAVGAERVGEAAGDDWRHRNVFTHDKHVPGTWRNACAGECAHFEKTILVRQNETHIVRHEYWRYMNLWYPVYAAFDVWPSVESIPGTIEDGVVTWGRPNSEWRETLNVSGGTLTLEWADTP